MKKKMLAVLLSATMLAATLAGCGNSSDTPSGGETAAETTGTEKEPGGGC